MSHFLFNRPADVIALFTSCSSCFPDVAVVLDPNLPFISWNVIEIGSQALFSTIHFDTFMWWYSSFDVVLLKELFLCILAIVPFRAVCLWGCLLRLRFGIMRRIFRLVCVVCGVCWFGVGICGKASSGGLRLKFRFLLW